MSADYPFTVNIQPGLLRVALEDVWGYLPASARSHLAARLIEVSAGWQGPAKGVCLTYADGRASVLVNDDLLHERPEMRRFIFAHELAHAAGEDSEDGADAQARRWGFPRPELLTITEGWRQHEHC